jgi:hypothetical protein
VRELEGHSGADAGTVDEQVGLTHSVSILRHSVPLELLYTLTIDRGLRSATKQARTSVKRLVLEQHDLFSTMSLSGHFYGGESIR